MLWLQPVYILYLRITTDRVRKQKEKDNMTNMINIYPQDEPDNHVWIAFVIDGEVAMKMPFPLFVEHVAACVSSDPKLIVLEGDDRLKVNQGWTYDGEYFNQPSE